mgnify:CR=1 FL=1
MNTTPPRIKTTNLQRIYKIGSREIPALQGIDLEVPAGHIVALRGRSGSGKTTLLNCISGLDRPTAGTVQIDGQDITGMSERKLVQLRRQAFGFIGVGHEHIQQLERLAHQQIIQFGIDVLAIHREEDAALFAIAQ